MRHDDCKDRSMACITGKRCYRNRAIAIRWLLFLRFDERGRLKNDPERREQAWYLCGMCQRIHLTSSDYSPMNLRLNDECHLLN